MRWKALRPLLLEVAGHCPTPLGIIIHLGGNDVGRKRNIELFSSIVLRPCWSRGAKWRGRRINNVLQMFLCKEKGYMYHNHSLEGEQLDLFQDVHLSNEGNCIFVSSL